MYWRHRSQKIISALLIICLIFLFIAADFESLPKAKASWLGTLAKAGVGAALGSNPVTAPLAPAWNALSTLPGQSSNNNSQQNTSQQPLTLSAKNSKDSNVALSWNALPAASGYRILKDGNNILADTKSTSYTDKQVQGDHIYRLVAYGPGGSTIIGTSVLSVSVATDGTVTSKIIPNTAAIDNAIKANNAAECQTRCQSPGAWGTLMNLINPSDAISNAICNVQCHIITWFGNVAGLVISTVLYPALGLCDDTPGSTNPCPL